MVNALLRVALAHLTLLAAIKDGSAAQALRGQEETEQQQRSLIMRGEPAVDLEFPFFVQSKDVTCGGSLVAIDMVATAAHCAGEFWGDVLVGASLRNQTENTSAQWRKVLSKMVIHPQYNWGSDKNDYMMFQIEPVTNPGLVPIELNTDPDVPRVGDQFMVVGMGYNGTNVTVSHPDRLLKVPVRYVEHELCQGQWALVDDYYYYNETKAVYEESMFCAIGDVVETKGPTSGDSGGPVFDVATNRLVGIVSWGGPFPDKSATPFYPSVFSRVSFAADWMKETICKLTSDRGSLSFDCPSFRCPLDEQILGFPQAIIPDRIASVQSDFPVTNVVQSPAPGSLVNANATHPITITATNELTNTDVSCTFYITVGPVEYLGGTSFVVNASNVKRRLQKSITNPNDSLNNYPRARGNIHRIRLELDSKLLGRGAKMSSQVIIGRRKYKQITLGAGRNATSVNVNPAIPFVDTNSLFISWNSTYVTLPGAARSRKYDVVVYLYGQKMY